MRLPVSTTLILLLQASAVVSFSNQAFDSKRSVGRLKADGSFSNLQAFGKSEASESLGKFSVPSSRGTRAPKVDGKPSAAWDSFKAAIYGTVDNVGSISEKLQRGEEDLGVQEGYSVRETDATKKSYDNVSPGQRLMDDYRSRSSQLEAIGSQGSAFDSFKSTVYGTFDTLSSFATDKSGREDDFQSFRSPVQSTMAPTEIQMALSDLESKNPVKRKIAELKVKNYEEQEKRRKRAQEREEAARSFKESVYKVGDSIAWSVETIASVPSKVSYAAEETGKAAKNVKKTVDEIPSKVDGAVQTFISVPDLVKEKTNQLQTSAKTSVENTQKTIQEIQGFPSRVQKSIKDTQERVESTREAIDDSITKVKVLAGLEKPKPKPPKTPPPAPPTAKDIGLKVAGSVVSGTAKATWWVSKSVAGAAWNGVQSAVKKAKGKAKSSSATTTSKTPSPKVEPPRQAQESTVLSSSTIKKEVKPKATEEKVEADTKSEKGAKLEPPGSKEKFETAQDPSELPSSTSEDDVKSKAKESPKVATDSSVDKKKKAEESSKANSEDVDKEVEEALRQAQSALNFADEESSKRPDVSTDSDKEQEKNDADEQ